MEEERYETLSDRFMRFALVYIRVLVVATAALPHSLSPFCSQNPLDLYCMCLLLIDVRCPGSFFLLAPSTFIIL